MNIVFLSIYFVWLLTEVLLNRLLHSKQTDRQHADKNSLSLIWAAIIVVTTLAVFISMNYYLPIGPHPLIPYVGLALVVFGIVIRFVAIYTLGRFFTVDVTIRQGHELKRDGLYRYLRHPSYAASLLSFTGFGMSLNNWLALMLLVVTILVVFIIRIKVEEKILTEQFGSAYIEYRKKTSALIPFIY